ncbi:MAG: transglycosylase SLT domain-containing protein [Rubrivivax sp.]|nr:transglycosylase SLT domain-containing protein [Rubrivivax sp.]
MAAFALAVLPPAAAAQWSATLAAAPNELGAAAALLETLPRPSVPPAEKGPVVPAQVQRWRQEAVAAEYGDGVPRDALRAAALYCRAARYGDAEAQYALGWMLTNGRGIERNDAHAAHLFAAAAEQGHAQAAAMAARLGDPVGPPPPCLRPPDADVVAQAPVRAAPPRPAAVLRKAQAAAPAPPLPANAPEPIVRYVRLAAPDYKLEPWLVLAVMAAESNFNAGAVSPKNAQGLMQLIPDTARRFGVKDLLDPVQNIRGGMAYLRWLLAYYEGDVSLALAAYNAGEGAVDRYLGVPPFAETRNYVLKILVSLNGRRTHPYDLTATLPSPRLALMRELWRR